MKCFLRSTLFLVLVCSCQLSAQSNSNIHSGSSSADTTKFRIVTAYLNDGTRIWGLLESQELDTMIVMDFNAGELYIGKSEIKESEISPVTGSVIVETVNGTSYYGEITGLQNGLLSIRSDLIGDFQIQSNTISKISMTGGYVSRKGGTWFSNPNATRYFFAPSAIPLKKHEGYFQNAYLLANSVNVGITNNITVGGGVVIPVLF
ncbi:MAG TPA: hypothetical protein VL651_14895, partial [Bacteroidia bacterium]|nr:hypothetical protein [Bacteroidia bacterium]